MTHRTDAHALHAILTAVTAAPHANGLRSAWAVALNAESRSPEFSRRHGEVIGLFNRTVQQINVLPDSKRVNYQPWVLHWWSAVVSPAENWDAGTTMAVIDAAPLSLLHAAGDVIESSQGGTSSAPGGASIETLESALSTWVEELKTGPDLLPNSGLRKTIIEQLEHVLWLVSCRDLFGDAPVAAAVQEVVGATALAAPHVPQDQQGKWRSRIFSVIVALSVFNSMVDQSQLAIENASTVVIGAIEAGSDVVDEVLGGD